MKTFCVAASNGQVDHILGQLMPYDLDIPIITQPVQLKHFRPTHPRVAPAATAISPRWKLSEQFFCIIS